jgi:hypothetical protein
MADTMVIIIENVGLEVKISVVDVLFIVLLVLGAVP